ncbi:MAG: phytanoyl-CoA dioxygenase family protein [Phycisphaeraceae bacterium]|nr:phytanoyl-CoA dioxygenase family protein [Phycisphaeraceae bacterium]
MSADHLFHDSQPGEVSEFDRYFFDLHGFVIVRGALSEDELADANERIDEIIPIEPGTWHGYVQAHNYTGAEGTNLQQIYEAGGTFEAMIDHPSWIEKILEFVGGEGTFDQHHGELFIDECFASIRGPGERIGMHSGNYMASRRTKFDYRDGQFMCGQVNVLVALNDIGPGDGPTMVIPGSHKSNFAHPGQADHDFDASHSMDGAVGSIEAHLDAGDALIFTDSISHGSAERKNEGERRLCVYRYGPSWGFFRHGFRPSRQLLERLTERQRKIVWPHEPMKREPNRVEGIPDPNP